MKRISKGLRSISPFSRRGTDSDSNSKMKSDELQAASDDDDHSNGNSSNGNTNTNTASIASTSASANGSASASGEKYSLNGVSFRDFLIHFYSKFNPEKIGMIDYIAQEYQGDELIMISNLADKYNLGHAEMQRIIDASKRALRQQQVRPAVSDTDSEPESEPNSEPTVSELSTGSLRHGGHMAYSSQQRGRKGVSFSGANSVRTFDRDASPLRSDNGRNTSPAPASLQDIINRNRPHEQSPKPSIASRGLLGNSLLSPSQQPGTRKPSPSMRSPSPTVGKGGGPQPHPAPARSSSPLQNLVQSQGQGQGSPDAAQRMLNQKILREKMLQNQQQEILAQQRQQLLDQQREQQEQRNIQLQYEQQQHEQQQQQQQQQEAEMQQKTLQQVIQEDEEYVAQQVREQSQQPQVQDKQDVDGSSRTQSVHIEEIKLELARTKQALNEADKERDEVLHLLEEMAAAPMQMKSVVEAYLDNRSRSNSIQHSRDVSVCSDPQTSPPYESQYQQQLRKAQDRTRYVSSGDSVASSGSNSLRSPRDLQGQDYGSRTLSPAMRGGSGTAKAKSYMLGTASSSKRETSNALHGGKTGAFNIHANGNGRHPSPMFDRPSSASSMGAASVRSSSTGGQQFGQRYIRPSSATGTGSRGRSASPASSAYGRRGMRSSSPASSITSADVERQYASTKQRINSNTQKALTNQQVTQQRIDKTSQDAAVERQKAISKRVIPDSPSRQRNVNSESVTDWVVCVDPKSQKKYYYSRSLGKSTWTAPPHLAAASSTATGEPPSRSGSTTSKSRGSANWRSSSPGANSAQMRSASPAGSTASSRGGGGSAIWKSAKDPKTGRMYWFNRKTRESTWKNPFEVG